MNTVNTDKGGALRTPKLAIIYFTFDKDKALLEQSLRSIERIRANYPNITLDVYCLDDAGAPMTQIPENVDFYDQTSWDRKGNLNGMDNLEGSLKAYKKILDKGYDWAIKVDSDTYINDLEWLLPADPEKHGQVGIFSHKYYAHGCIYAVSKLGVEKALEVFALDHIQTRLRYGSVCEDIAVSVLIDVAMLPKHRISCTNILGGCHGGYQDFDWEDIGLPRCKDPNPELMLKHMSVTFKQNSHGRTAEERDADRADALVRMTAYANWVEALESKL